jgi:hypothetical protein
MLGTWRQGHQAFRLKESPMFSSSRSASGTSQEEMHAGCTRPRPGCTHAYAVNGHAVAQTLLDEIGHDLVMAVDLATYSPRQIELTLMPAYKLPPPHHLSCPALMVASGTKRPPVPRYCAFMVHGVESVLTKRLGTRNAKTCPPMTKVTKAHIAVTFATECTVLKSTESKTSYDPNIFGGQVLHYTADGNA